MSKQPFKTDFIPADEQAERAARRRGLTAAQVAEQDTQGENPEVEDELDVPEDSEDDQDFEPEDDED